MKHLTLLILFSVLTVGGYAQLDSQRIDTSVSSDYVRWEQNYFYNSGLVIRINDHGKLTLGKDTVAIVKYLIDQWRKQELRAESLDYELYKTRVQYMNFCEEVLTEHQQIKKIWGNGIKELNQIINPNKNEKTDITYPVVRHNGQWVSPLEIN